VSRPSAPAPPAACSNTSRQVGGALAIAVYGALLANLGFFDGLRPSLLIAALLLVATTLARASPCDPPHSPEGASMTAWTSEELTRIGTAEDLEIAFLRRDGTLGRPRTIWVVPLP
jgi:predicted lipid-binding transport protein (Tim44 family)